MSQGLHSGEFHLFLVGSSHRELLVAGAGRTLVTLMEKAADAGEVVVSARDRGAAAGGAASARRRVPATS